MMEVPEVKEWPTVTTLANGAVPSIPCLAACTMSCRCCAVAVAVSVLLGGWVLSPLPRRSTTRVAYPAEFMACRKL